MHLVVGLGNPGPDYARNRHNIGFMAADDIVRRHAFGPWRKRFQGEIAEGQLLGGKVIVLKPATFMNLSGQAVIAALGFYKVPPKRVIVIHDELALPAGKIHCKLGGGHAGHNGIRNIDAHIGPDYHRIRIGIGHPGDRSEVSNHVLHDFAKADRDWLEPTIEAISTALPVLMEKDCAAFLNEINRLRPPPPKPETETKAPKLVPGRGEPTSE